jgi:Protein of unknown function (DUF3054)
MMLAVRPMTDGSRLTRWFLLGDLLGLLAFLVIGLDRHGEDVVGRFAALAAIFVFAWLATAWSLGTYRPPTNGTLVLTLVLAIPLGVLVRAAFVQTWTMGEVATFAGVAVVFGTLFIGIARLIVTLLARMKRAR